MCGQKALRIALDLRHVPSLVRHVRGEPLPEGVSLLLRIAAGDSEAEQHALQLVDRSLDEIREAAAFFIEQILFAPGSDSYRVLGARPDASAAELRRNMALLMKWLHPDADTGERGVFVGRVTSAWDDLKTADRRADYDSRMGLAGDNQSGSNDAIRPSKKLTAKRSRMNSPKHTHPRVKSRSLTVYRHRRSGLLARVLSLLAGRRWLT